MTTFFTIAPVWCVSFSGVIYIVLVRHRYSISNHTSVDTCVDDGVGVCGGVGVGVTAILRTGSCIEELELA